MTAQTFTAPRVTATVSIFDHGRHQEDDEARAAGAVHSYLDTLDRVEAARWCAAWIAEAEGESDGFDPADADRWVGVHARVHEIAHAVGTAGWVRPGEASVAVDLDVTGS